MRQGDIRSFTKSPHPFDAIDIEQMRLLAGLAPGQRVQVMLEARELAVGLMRGRLCNRYPDLSPQAINLKLIEEISHAQQRVPRF